MSFKQRTASLLLGTLSLSILPTMANAADLDVISHQSWTGFYGGLAVGAGGNNQKLDAALGGANISFDGIGAEGYLGSIYAGYDYQIAPEYVVGLMVDYTFSNIETTIGGTIPPVGSAAFNLTADQSWSVLARAGYLSGPDTLIYALGGYTHQNFDGELGIFNAGGAQVFGTSYSFDLGGLTAGGGIENRLGNGLSAKIEYRYTQLDEVGIIPPFLTAEPSMQTVRFGLSYKYGMEGGDAPQKNAIAKDWTGFLFGVDLGGHTAATEIGLNAAPLVTGSFNGIGAEGASVGVRLGYDHQIAQDWVAGIQFAASASNLSTDLNTNLGFNASIEQEYSISLIGRAGWLATPDTLWYGLAGFTWTEGTISGTGLGSASQDLDGFVVGAGMETAITENLSAFLEYRYTQYNDVNALGGVLSFEPSVHSAHAGLNYKFNFGE